MRFLLDTICPSADLNERAVDVSGRAADPDH
jgi:hypothetical protein